MKAVADWQVENWDKVRYGWDDWTNGALYVGMYAWGEMADVAGQKNPYFAFLTKVGNRNGWQPVSGCIMPTIFAWRKCI